jgi:hypothetical protein
MAISEMWEREVAGERRLRSPIAGNPPQGRALAALLDQVTASRDVKRDRDMERPCFKRDAILRHVA